MSHLNSVSCFDWIWHHLFYYLLKKSLATMQKNNSQKKLRCRTKKVILTLLKTLLWISLKKIELHLFFLRYAWYIQSIHESKQKETKSCAFCFHKLLFSLYNAVSCIFFLTARDIFEQAWHLFCSSKFEKEAVLFISK